MKIKLLILLSFSFLNYKAISQIRVLTIGNSITQGSNQQKSDGKTEFSYRPWLWDKMVVDGFNVDMVGYHRFFFGEQGGTLDMKFNSVSGKEFDRETESYYGIRSSSFVNGDNSTGWTGAPLPKFSDRINDPNKGYTPDMVLLHMGSNDPDGTAAEIALTEQNIKAIIATLRAKNPNVVILLGKLITFWKKINGEIDRIAQETSTAASPVISVDHTKGWIQNDMTYDGVHPNEKGQKFMMNTWYRALKANLNDKVKPTLVNSVTASEVTESTASLNWPLGTDNYGIQLYEVYANNVKIATLNNSQKPPYIARDLNAGTDYTFKVVAKDFGGNASDTAIIKAKTLMLTALSTDEALQNIKVFPSPTKGLTTISGVENASINVTDISGQIVMTATNVSGMLDLSNLSDGIYFIRIQQEKLTAARKIVIRKE